MRKDVLRCKISNIETVGFEDESCKVQMVLLSGEFTCEYGKGIILQGGVDTQVYEKGQPGKTFARFILQGMTSTGTVFHIYLQNNGEFKENDAVQVTWPKIRTDLPGLKWAEDADLIGNMMPIDEETTALYIYTEVGA